MIFDTTFLIDFEREVKRAQPGRAHSFLVQNPRAPLHVSIVTLGEFAEGFSPTQPPDFEASVALYTVLDLDRDVIWRAGQIARDLRSSGAPIGGNDVWIAATALQNGLPLVTRNAQHFQRISGLTTILY